MEMIIGLFVVAAIIFLLIVANRKPQSQAPGNSYIYAYGRDLYFDRSEIPGYVAEAKRRINILLSNLPFQLAGYDLKAVASIIAWETGWVSAESAYVGVVEKNNIMGISTGGTGQILQTFPTTYQCVDYFKNMVETYQRYALAKLYKSDGERFIQELWAGGYNENISWRDGILSIYRNW